MYAAAVTRAGAVAVVLPPPGQTAVDDLGGHAAAVVARLDGLVLAGGDDVDPARYAVTRHPLADDPQPDRDAWEIALTRAAIESDLPLLGICRGMQIMAIAAGGTLDQHLPDVVGTTVHSPTPAGARDRERRLRRVPQSRGLRARGGDRRPVASCPRRERDTPKRPTLRDIPSITQSPWHSVSREPCDPRDHRHHDRY